ncbi:MAG: NAD(P)H-binding protein [bacterium]|nr:MAG: NAD(P)H-binding protein [bacterium]
MDQQVFLTGGSGKTGQALLHLLSTDERFAIRQITCLCRPGGRADRLRRFGVSIAVGDASDPESLRAAYGGQETVIHLSSIFHTGAVLAGCVRMKRLIAVSSTGVFSRHRSNAGAITAVEREIENSAIAYTILRPTMIYGAPDDRNISRLIGLVHRHSLIPLPASGRSVFQPVHVTDLASCIAAALGSPESIGKSYNVPGGSAHTLREMVTIVAGLLGRRVRVVPVPYWTALIALRLAKAIRPGLRLDTEQIERLREDKSFDYTDAARELSYTPMTFPEGVKKQMHGMGLL